MLTKTKMALAAALVAATSSVALAQEFDPNLANRYPGYNGPAAATQSFQSAPVRLQNNFQSAPVRLQNNSGDYVGQSTGGRPQVHTFHYDSAPVISGGGY